MAQILLAIGYVLAVPPLFVIKRLLKKPNERNSQLALLSEWLGAGMISVGWFVLDKKIGGVINLTWLIIFSGLWLQAARKKK